MSTPKADLHLHTTFSDGTFSPAEVVKRASEVGLSCIAICDHDCVDGIKPAISAASQYGIEVIPGIELTAERHGREVHILGYFIDIEDRIFLKKLMEIRQIRVERIYKMVDKLKGAGLRLDPEKVFKLSGDGSVGRLHLAHALHKEGLISNVNESFKWYIGDTGPCYVKGFKLKPEEAVETILKVGGIPVMAHPYTMGGDKLLLELIKVGLRGVEAYHPDNHRGIRKHFVEIAEEFGLVVTGGSDCHGAGKERILMGTVMVQYSIVERLKEEKARMGPRG